MGVGDIRRELRRKGKQNKTVNRVRESNEQSLEGVCRDLP